MASKSTQNNQWTTLAITIATLAAIFFAANGGLRELAQRWIDEEAYSHGFVMLLVALYFAWQATEKALSETKQRSWLGLFLSISAIVTLTLSEVAQIRTLSQYAVLGLLFSLPLASFGWKFTRHYVPPLAMLLFVIPLPFYIQVAVTAKLQLWSSAMGVAGIKLMGIPVYLEGNVIDLGVYKLQVVEACSGLNYLYPMIGIAFIFAFLNKGSIWVRSILVLSAIPIAILMNGLRIVMVGILVREFGTESAEGFLHEFQGFAVFAMSMVLLGVVAWILSKLDRKKGAVNTAPIASDAIKHIDTHTVKTNGSAYTACVSLALLLLSIVTTSSYAKQTNLFPDRTTLALFPTQVNEWSGVRKRMSIQALSLLNPTDYTVIEFEESSDEPSVEFYTAYYDNQKDGNSIHSPKVCLPGGGWEILNIGTVAGLINESSRINRAVLQSGTDQMLAYYWFEQRGRTLASEFWLKWYLLVDGLTTKRSDGALVRFTTRVGKVNDKSIEQSDARIRRLIEALNPHLPKYIPGS